MKVNRILVVSDDVAYDAMRKAMLIQASPPEVKVNVITVAKMIEIYFDDRFDDSFRAMLLFTRPQDVVTVVKHGVVLDSVNIGGMSFSSGKKMITNAVAVDSDDIDAFNYLDSQGIALEIRKVVADSQVNLMELLKKKAR